MTRAPGVVRFLRDCYEADSRELGLFNLFDEKVRPRLVLDGREQIACGDLSRLPLEAESLVPLQKAAAVYQREKSLLYAAFFVTGARGATRLCAPLFFYPARVVETQPPGEIAFLEVEAGEQRVNAPLLAALLGEGESSAAVEDLLARLPATPFHAAALFELREALAEFLPALDLSVLTLYPELSGEAALREAMGGPLRILPAAAAAVVPNPPENRGVLFELARLADEPRLSPPLRAMLDGEEPPRRPPRRTQRRAPAVLSDAQSRILDSASAQPLTLVILRRLKKRLQALLEERIDSDAAEKAQVVAQEKRVTVLDRRIAQLERARMGRGGKREDPPPRTPATK